MVNPITKKNNHQFFFEWVFTAWKKKYKIIPNWNIHWNLRLLLSKFTLVRSIPFFKDKKNAYLILGAGYPDSFIFPYSFRNEVIPVLWDTWPVYHNRLIASIKRNDIKVIFVTASQTKTVIENNVPQIKCFYLPEGIDPNGYKKGNNLIDRNIDILELGRLMDRFHSDLLAIDEKIMKTHLF